MVTTTKLALCPDGVKRAYTMEGEIAIVEVRGYRVEGKITEEDRVTKFRQAQNHHGAHLVVLPSTSRLGAGVIVAGRLIAHRQEGW